MGSRRNRIIAGLVCLLAAPTWAADGRSEINQAVVDAAGGFPLAIDTPGNYVLTGPLVVPADTDAIVLTTNEVVLDLNGFSISGPATCSSGGCAQGAGSAIRGLPGIAFGRRTTIRNGTVRGFAGSCVALGSQVRVDDLLVTECGRNGILVFNGSVVTNSRVLQTGEHGILMSGTSHPPVYAHNTVAQAGLGGGDFAAVKGGVASAGNSCDDGSCPRQPRRRFYLTAATVIGSQALDACAPGFHMASIWEIHDPTGLQYDRDLGVVNPESDQGQGPPSSRNGWIRGSFTIFNDTAAPGLVSCTGWTQPTGNGTHVQLDTVFSRPPATVVGPWIPGTGSCASPRSVWCVED